MICERCGTTNPKNGKYCLNCGSLLPNSPPQKQGGADNVIAVIIIILMALLIAIAGMLIYHFTIANGSLETNAGIGGGGGGSGSIVVTEQESVPDTEEEETEEENEENKLDLGKISEQSAVSLRERLSKKDEFNAEANLIEEYSRRYLETAITQNELNVESGIVFEKWDALLNDVYIYLKEILSEQAFAQLQRDELAWIKEKETAIDAAGAEWDGGTGETMARNSVAIKYTRERCYYLIDLVAED